MWPVTQRYLDTLAKPHTQLSYIEILKDGDVVATMESGTLLDPDSGLPVHNLGGRIDVSKTTIRRNGTINLLDVSGQLSPDTADDLLAPYVTEIRAWVGVRYWNAPPPALVATATTSTLQDEAEFVPIGTLVITDLDVNYPAITITGYDRAWHLTNFPSVYSVPGSSNIIDAVTDILATFVPTSKFEVNFPTSDKTTGPTLNFDADAASADAVYQMITILGWDLYPDPMGVWTITPQPSTEDDPVLEYVSGPGSMLAGRPKHTVGGDPVNAVVFTGEGAETVPVRGYAQDDDPTSLTYVDRIGVRTYFASSPLMTTNAQCDLAARTRLTSVLGSADTMSVPGIPNHALESGDVIHVVDPDQDIDAKVIVDSFSTNMRASDGVQDLTCRSKVIR